MCRPIVHNNSASLVARSINTYVCNNTITKAWIASNATHATYTQVRNECNERKKSTQETQLTQRPKAQNARMEAVFAWAAFVALRTLRKLRCMETTRKYTCERQTHESWVSFWRLLTSVDLLNRKSAHRLLISSGAFKSILFFTRHSCTGRYCWGAY